MQQSHNKPVGITFLLSKIWITILKIQRAFKHGCEKDASPDKDNNTYGR